LYAFIFYIELLLKIVFFLNFYSARTVMNNVFTQEIFLQCGAIVSGYFPPIAGYSSPVKIGEKERRHRVKI
jgi:hypothetical protein